MEKKEIGSKVAVKAIITGFVSYGIIAIFLGFIILIGVDQFLNMFDGKDIMGLYITIPLMSSIIIYFAIHTLCRISTYDVFKKCKTNPDNYKTICKYLNIFFIFCIIFTILLCLTIVYNKLKYQVIYIEHRKTDLLLQHVYPEDYINNKITRAWVETYEIAKTNLIVSSTILVTGIAISFLSLINYQKKMLNKYNEFQTENKES